MITDRSDLISKSPALTESASDSFPAPAKPAGIESERLNWWGYTTFTLAHAASGALLLLLTLPGLHRFGRVLGTFEWLINYKRRRRFATALRQVLGRGAAAVDA